MGEQIGTTYMLRTPLPADELSESNEAVLPEMQLERCSQKLLKQLFSGFCFVRPSPAVLQGRPGPKAVVIMCETVALCGAGTHS